jgi:hypothetical protein
MAVLLVLAVVAIGAVLGLFGVFVAYVGAVTLGKALRERWLAQRAERWVPLEARVVRSEVEHTRTGRASNHVPVVTYEFEHGGQTYRSSRLAFSTSLTPPRRNEQQVREITARFAVGTHVTVYVDAERPEEATVERNRPGLVEPVFFFVVLTGVGAAFVYCGIDIAIGALRNPPPL